MLNVEKWTLCGGTEPWKFVEAKYRCPIKALANGFCLGLDLV